MSSYDSAEVSKLLGVFLLNKLNHVNDKGSEGLYRDNELGVLKSNSGPEAERK